MLKIKSLLISQPSPQLAEKSPYYNIHQKFGVSLAYRPFMRMESVSVKDYLSQRVDILEHDTVILSSRTSVDHFFSICDEARINVPETMKYLCNTEAVALYLQKYIVYRKRKISFSDGSFTGFMNMIVKHKNEKLLLILSEPHKPELPEAMEKLKLNFHKLILSRAVNSDLSDINIKDYDILAFFSPAEINSLTAQFGNKDLPFIATFGDGTTKAAIEAGLDVALRAPTPEAPSMAKAIELFISKAESGEKIEPIEFQGTKKVEDFLMSHAGTQKKSKSRKTSTDKTA